MPVTVGARNKSLSKGVVELGCRQSRVWWWGPSDDRKKSEEGLFFVLFISTYCDVYRRGTRLSLPPNAYLYLYHTYKHDSWLRIR